MNGVDSRLLGYVLKKLAKLFGNRQVDQKWFNQLVESLGDAERQYREFPEVAEHEQGEQANG